MCLDFVYLKENHTVASYMATGNSNNCKITSTRILCHLVDLLKMCIAFFAWLMVFLCHIEVCVSLKYGAPILILFYNLNKDFSVLYLNVIWLCTRKTNKKQIQTFVSLMLRRSPQSSQEVFGFFCFCFCFCKHSFIIDRTAKSFA